MVELTWLNHNLSNWIRLCISWGLWGWAKKSCRSVLLLATAKAIQLLTFASSGRRHRYYGAKRGWKISPLWRTGTQKRQKEQKGQMFTKITVIFSETQCSVFTVKMLRHLESERSEARPDQAFENQKWEEQQDRDRKAREMQEARPQQKTEPLRSCARFGRDMFHWYWSEDFFFDCFGGYPRSMLVYFLQKDIHRLKIQRMCRIRRCEHVDTGDWRPLNTCKSSKHLRHVSVLLALRLSGIANSHARWGPWTRAELVQDSILVEGRWGDQAKCHVLVFVGYLSVWDGLGSMVQLSWRLESQGDCSQHEAALHWRNECQGGDRAVVSRSES